MGGVLIHISNGIPSAATQNEIKIYTLRTCWCRQFLKAKINILTDGISFLLKE